MVKEYTQMKNIVKSLLIILLLIFSILLFYHFIGNKFRNKHNFEKSNVAFSQNTQNSPFSISKVVMYSSAYGENKNTTFQQNCWILDILQYTDIAIYIDRTSAELNANNSIKKLSLQNLKISGPKIGSGDLYYLDSLNFGTPTKNETYKLTNSLEFSVLNDANKDNWAQYNTPIFFTDCSNPITLKYVNPAVKQNYPISSNEPIFWDGRLLQLANISLGDLTAIVEFTIVIENNQSQKFMYPFILSICLENESSSIYNGHILFEKEYENAPFFEKKE